MRNSVSRSSIKSVHVLEKNYEKLKRKYVLVKEDNSKLRYANSNGTTHIADFKEKYDEALKRMKEAEIEAHELK